MGTPAETAADAVAGSILLNEQQASEGYTITVTPSDSQATVKYAAADGVTDPTVSDNNKVTLTNEGFFYVEVTAANGTTKLIYKMKVSLPRSPATIKYGKPIIKDSAEKYIDHIWESVTETYAIDRIASGESVAYEEEVNKGTKRPTTGVAKAMWDENGLYNKVLLALI
jgi:hypothetical protein